MRAFHYSWWGFFIAFFIWFAIAPLLTEVKETLGLSKQQVWTSSIAGVGGTIFMRFLLGPMCDKYGPRIPFAMVSANKQMKFYKGEKISNCAFFAGSVLCIHPHCLHWFR